MPKPGYAQPIAFLRPALQTTPLRLIVREAVDQGLPICSCSAEVAERQLRDALLAKAIVDDIRADPDLRIYRGDRLAMLADIDAAITATGGWIGALEWLQRVILQKVQCHAAAGSPLDHGGRPRVEHTALQVGLILNRLRRVV